MLEHLFQAGGALVAPFWALMIFAPRWRWTERLVSSWWIVAAPAVVYLALVAPQLSSLLQLLARPTLAAVAPLLGSPEGATIGWFHFLAFDLFVGRAVFLDARARGVRWYVTSPVLLAVFMVGPVGLLGALLVRLAWPQVTSVDESLARSKG